MNLFPPSAKLLVVSHDAGGAEILSSLMKDVFNPVDFVLGGPAVAIFARKLGFVPRASLLEALPSCDIVLCGTSWQSDLEHDALKEAKRLGKRTYCFLDHWINYLQRFKRNGETVLPHTLLVGDEFALKIARDVFPVTDVRLVENPYFKEIESQLRRTDFRQRPGSGLHFLYVCSPIKEHAEIRFGNERHWGYVEEEALRYFLENIDVLGDVAHIVVRLHPSEKPNKYDDILREFDLPFSIGGDRTLVDEIADCDVVVGDQTMALVVALIAGKKAVSSIPPEGNECALPHPQIVKLKDALKERKV